MNEAASRRRVLMTADAVGGVWQYATDLAGELATRGFDIVLALLGPPASARQRAAIAAMDHVALIETGLPLDWLADTPEQIAAAGRAIADLAQAERVDLVQLNQPALAKGVAFAVPVIAVAHSCLATWWAAVEGGTPPADFAWRAALHGQGLAAADRTVCPTAAFAEATQAAYALPVRPAAIHNGRSLAIPAAPGEDFAFAVGRLWDRGKDAATLDRVAARLAVPLRAAGPTAGPNGERVALAHAEALGPIDDEDIADRLARRPVFVSTARYEPFGLAVLEAASAGCALVLADIPGFRELWGGAATFVARGDDAAFAAAIGRLIDDRALRAEAGERARAAAARYTPARTGAAMAALYAELLQHSDRAAA